jgi:hypothetical protein
VVSSNYKSPSTTIMSTFQKPSTIRHLKVDTNVPAVDGPRSSKARTPYCGVCFKAKQPSSVYNSHWTRMNPNPRSPITCPLILQTVCNYCKNKGHSAKHCPVAAKKNERRRLRASSVSSNVSSSQNSVASSPNEKGSWLQAAMKSLPSDTKTDAESDKRRLSLENPSTLETKENHFPSPPKLRRTRENWNWNDDFDSDSD